MAYASSPSEMSSRPAAPVDKGGPSSANPPLSAVECHTSELPASNVAASGQAASPSPSIRPLKHHDQQQEQGGEAREQPSVDGAAEAQAEDEKRGVTRRQDGGGEGPARGRVAAIETATATTAGARKYARLSVDAGSRGASVGRSSAEEAPEDGSGPVDGAAGTPGGSRAKREPASVAEREHGRLYCNFYQDTHARGREGYRGSSPAPRRISSPSPKANPLFSPSPSGSPERSLSRSRSPVLSPTPDRVVALTKPPRATPDIRRRLRSPHPSPMSPRNRMAVDWPPRREGSWTDAGASGTAPLACVVPADVRNS
eukprot:jgi/Mesen1/3959/ME000021S03485